MKSIRPLILALTILAPALGQGARKSSPRSRPPSIPDEQIKQIKSRVEQEGNDIVAATAAMEKAVNARNQSESDSRSSARTANLTNWIIAILTAVIALATTYYAWLTRRLWKETEKSATAAKDAAEIAKQSAELIGALHRPFVAIKGAVLQGNSGSGTWYIGLELKNYGTLPALKTTIQVECFADTTPLRNTAHPSPVQIFPNDQFVSQVEIFYARR